MWQYIKRCTKKIKPFTRLQTGRQHLARMKFPIISVLVRPFHVILTICYCYFWGFSGAHIPDGRSSKIKSKPSKTFHPFEETSTDERCWRWFPPVSGPSTFVSTHLHSTTITNRGYTDALLHDYSCPLLYDHANPILHITSSAGLQPSTYIRLYYTGTTTSLW